MNKLKNKIDIPPQGIETPKGYLYNPPELSRQIIALVAFVFIAVFLGWVLSSLPGDLSDFARSVFYIPFILVFFFGYSAWLGWLNVIVFDTIKWSMIKTLFAFFINRKKPESAQELLPSNEKIIELMVRAQKATKTFFIVSWPIGIIDGIAVTFLKTSANTPLLSVAVTASTIFYGYTISYFGRRGYLPFPEE
jgi:hypothetical protein